MILFCKYIHCKSLMKIRRCRYNRNCTQKLRNFQSEFICSAKMSRQKRNHKFPAFINHQYRRIRFFTYHVRCNAAHRNSTGSDKNDCIICLKMTACPDSGTFRNRILEIFTFLIKFYRITFALKVFLQIFRSHISCKAETDD